MTQLRSALALALALLACLLTAAAAGAGDDVRWTRLSSKSGDLPAPGPSTQQTGALVADLDRDGVDDFVLAFRKVAPAVVWYRRAGNGWTRTVIDPEFLTVEAGGAAWDIDGDGDLDIVFGGDWQSNEVWWWENPYPRFDGTPWTRRVIKKAGATQHHDQAFGDFKGTGRSQLAFWNQGAKTIFLADIPADPRGTSPWPSAAIFSGSAGEKGDAGKFLYAEGMAAADVDGDGKTDLLAGNFWFKHEGGDRFTPVQVSPQGGRIAAGKLIPGKFAQVVIAPGDGVGPLRWFECTGDPAKPSDWKGHDLAGRDLVHGHSLALGDVDGDGNLDIFAAEMAQWTEGRPDADNPKATAWVFFGDGRGNFRKTELAVGAGFHEARLVDLDGDGDLDVLDKPYCWQAPRVDVYLNGGTGPRARGIGGWFKGPLGLELYSLRAELKKDAAATIESVRAMGFREVEAVGFLGVPADRLKELLDRSGLRATSCIATYESLAADAAKAFAEAKLLGARYVVCPWIPHQSDVFTEADARRAIGDFRAWGAAAREAGLRFAYHIHGYEFRPHGDGTLFDLLARETPAGVADFELDVFWAMRPGQDPAKLLRRYPGRFPLVHLKDLKKGERTGDFSGGAPDESSVVLGTGQLDLPAFLRAAAETGVERYYIEDEAPDAAAQIPQSVRALEAVRF